MEGGTGKDETTERLMAGGASTKDDRTILISGGRGCGGGGSIDAAATSSVVRGVSSVSSSSTSLNSSSSLDASRLALRLSSALWIIWIALDVLRSPRLEGEEECGGRRLWRRRTRTWRRWEDGKATDDALVGEDSGEENEEDEDEDALELREEDGDS